MENKDAINIAKPMLGPEEKNAVLEVMNSGKLAQGEKVDQFEKAFSAYIGTRHAVAVGNGTIAIHLALLAHGVGKGMEVVTTPFTFIGSVTPILFCQARPVFADIIEKTFNIDPADMKKARSAKTKAFIPVHLFGLSAEMDEIMELAGEIPVIEDACQAHGAAYKGRKAGSIGSCACYSFYPTKNMTTGEGGALTTDDDALADRVRVLMLHGMSRDAWKRFTSAGSWYYEVVEPGYKYNLTDVAAAIGIHQLRRLEGFTATRERYARALDDAFAGESALLTPVVRGPIRHARHLYPLLIRPEELTVDRAEFIEALKAENIGTTVNFIPVHLHPYYREKLGFRAGMFPNAEWVYEREISLPLYPKMTAADLEDVARAVLKVVHWRRRRP